MPCGPILIFCPLTTVVTGVLPEEIVKVWPSMIASDGVKENVRPAAVATEKVGSDFGRATVVLASPIPCGPILTV